MSAVLVSVRELCVDYPTAHGPVAAVRQVSFELHRGETLALVGESGAGKSTLGRALLRLLEVRSGEVLFEGVDLLKLAPAALRAIRRRLQPVFQDPLAALDPRLTVEQSLDEPLRIHRLPGSAQGLLKMVGLDAHLAARLPHQLSTGQRQRVCIARALAVEPELLILDEPVSALDVSVQAQVLGLLQRLIRERRLSSLFISHDLAVVSAIADRIAVLFAGRLVELGPAAQLLERPRHPYTQALLSAARGERAPIAELAPPAATGCAFAPRCPHATARCAQLPPLEADQGHAVACWLGRA